jgi:hypothetical protein
MAAIALVAWAGAPACAQSVLKTIEQSNQFNGYLENQEIIRNENYVKNYHVASIRNRAYLTLQGSIYQDITVPSLYITPELQYFSLNYYLSIRPEYEGAYDMVPDRFGNNTTGFSGIGYSMFDSPINKSAGFGLVKAFGYNPTRFKGVVARDFAFPMPVDPGEPFITSVNGVPFHCFHCINVNEPLSNLRFGRDYTNYLYYPVRSAYLGFHWNLFGQNFLRLGKQQIVWGKADFFRLQDIVNPVDYSQHFFIEPFSDTRIPQLSAWFQHRFGDLAFLHEVAGSLVWNFDYFNPVGLGQGGQPWAVAFGDEKRAFAFDNGLFDAGLCNGSSTPGVCNPNHVNFGLYREQVPDWRLDNTGIGTKWDFLLPYPSIRFALTDYYANQQTPTFVLSQLMAVPTLPGCANAATITSGFPGFYGPGGGGLPFIATNARSIHLAKNETAQSYLNHCVFGGGAEIRYHKANTLGLSADYFEPHTGVVIRVESSWTHDAMLNNTDYLSWQDNGDILQYVVGFDKPYFIKFLNPYRTFFSSLQVYETYYPGQLSENSCKDGLVTCVNNFTFTFFTQTHYYGDMIIPLIFAAYSTGTDATIGGNVQYLITDHWSATVGFDAFLGISHQHNVGPDALFQSRAFGGLQPPQDEPYSETIFGPAQDLAGGAERNVMDEFWTRVRYRF